MPESAVRLQSVYKKFRRGEIYDSLRDLIPGLVRSVWKRSADLTQESEFWALQDVTFDVPRGSAFAIVGPNGAGKSTILKLLSRVMEPTRGTVEVHGRVSALIEVGAGFHPDLTGRENVYLNGSILGMSRAEISRKLEQIVEFAGLSEFIDTPVKRYSSGMYARLGFAVAAHVDPEILIVDEVLSVGDYVFQNRCLERMREIKESGATILFVSHNLQAVTELCSRGVLLDKGRIVAHGEADEVVRTYLGRAREQHRSDEHKPGQFVEVTLSDQSGNDRARFEAGARAHLAVTFTTEQALDNVSVGIALMNEAFYRVFNTSTERLGVPTWHTEPGGKYRAVFELDLHLARGTFHFGVYLSRTDTGQVFDEWSPCVTFYVGSEIDARGTVNLYPSIVEVS